MDVHPVLLNWLASFLSNRFPRVKLGSHFSDWCPVSAGAPQGTKVGPLLFLTMVNDLRTQDNLVKYVDDSTLWEVLSENVQSELPSKVNDCVNWASHSDMKLNPSKTKEMLVSFRSNPPAVLPLIINNKIVEIVNVAKLLGVWILRT